mmetsp:Transcript_21887/g.33703  ORF Transcript_21887/g.33703 Transcript_21887/m.33703 type:complete len:361 (+) Transcript_21887:39-1121(+)
MATMRLKKSAMRADNDFFTQEPPSPMAHAGILARHAYKGYGAETKEEKLPPIQDTEAKHSQKLVREGSRKFSAALGSKLGGFFGRRGSNGDFVRTTPRGTKVVEDKEDDEETVVVIPQQIPPPRRINTPSKKKQQAVSPTNKKSSANWATYQIGISRPPVGTPLLGPRSPTDKRITLILDLDETLVRSSFDCTFEFDFEAPFALNGCWCTARVRKRPFVDEFLARVAKHFELIVITAGVEPYASLVLDILDQNRYLEHRFYRDSCTKTEAGLLVKDLSRMSRDLSQTLIVDNSPNAYLWHPQNAIDIDDFIGDPRDTQLNTVADFLETIKDAADVRAHLPHWRKGKHYSQVYNQNAKFSH